MLLSCLLWFANAAQAADATPVTIVDAHNSGAVLAIAEGRQRLASGGAEGRIHIARLTDGGAEADWFAHDGGVTGLVHLGDRSLWLSSGHDGDLALWDSDGRLLRRRSTPSPITDLAIDERRGRIATAHRDGTLGLWSLAGLEPLARHAHHRGQALAVAVEVDSGRIATAGSDGRVVIAARGATGAYALADPPTDAHDLAFSPDGRWLIGSGWFKLFRWEVARPAAIRVLDTPHHGLIRSIEFDRDGRRLATISRHTDSAVLLLDPATGTLVQSFPSHEMCGRALTLSRDGRYLVSSGDEASVRIHTLSVGSDAAP